MPDAVVITPADEGKSHGLVAHYTLRLPAGLRDRVKAAAHLVGRTMSDEIVRRVEHRPTVALISASPAIAGALEDKVLVRFPSDMYGTIMAEGKAAGRSFNSECIRRLQSSFVGEAEATEPVTAPVRRDPYREAAARRELAMDRVVFIAEAKRLQLFDELAAVKGHASRTEALRWAIEHAIEAWLSGDQSDEA